MFDADALFHLTNNKEDIELVKEIQQKTNSVILTPNIIEFKRIWEVNHKEDLPSAKDELAVYQSEESPLTTIDVTHPIVAPVAMLSREFNNARIIRKGLCDIITDGERALLVRQQGSLKRPGGIGDVLAGTIATFGQYTYSTADLPEL